MIRSLLRSGVVAVLIILFLSIIPVIPGLGASAMAQTPSAPSQDVEAVTKESEQTPEAPLSTVGRPVYDALQAWKKEISAKYGVDWALEDTVIYQQTTGGIDPNNAMVNTLGLYATWKIFRADNGKDFAGLGFQGETRCNPLNGEFTEMVTSMGTLWSPNDSTSDDYTKINQFWWAQRFAEGRLGYMIGKLDPGARINTNRFAGSGNTQFFGQPYATNPARSFPDNGLGFLVRGAPADWLYLTFEMTDSDAVSTGSPFTTLDGHWFYAGEMGMKSKIDGWGEGNYRFMVYYRDTESANEVGWSLSADQNLSDHYGMFLRYGANDAEINSVESILSGGLSFLTPFGRADDEAGIGVSWTHPSDSDFRDEYATEVYYRMQVTEGFELSASAQLILDPSANDEDAIGVFGLRGRLLY